jgi:hypothetical protein
VEREAMSTEEKLATFPKRMWPESRWSICVTVSDKNNSVEYRANAHGEWNPREKVYGKEQVFDSFSGAVDWLENELKDAIAREREIISE